MQPWLVRLLERSGPNRRSVGVFEYELHPEARYGWGKPAHPGILRLLASGEERYEKTVRSFFDFEEQFRRIPSGRHPEGGLSWDNDYWGGIDGVALYAFLAQRRPSTYLEVGSGFSTMFARRAIEDHGLPTRIISIDPHPRAGIDALCDRIARVPLERTDLGQFAQLEPGDVVLIDGSHTAFMNSDSVVTFLDVLPIIPPGVLVGIDDIFLPWDYHPTWAGRWYGEQYLLAAHLLGGSAGWELVFPAWYLTQESPLKGEFDPLWQHVAPQAGRYATSFWMERTAS